MTLPSYLSGGRIQGKTTDTVTPSVTVDLSSASGWGTPTRDSGDGISWVEHDTANSEIDFSLYSHSSIQGSIQYDFGSGIVNATQWVFRGKINIDENTTHPNDAAMYFGMTDTSGNPLMTANADRIFFVIYNDSGTINVKKVSSKFHSDGASTGTSFSTSFASDLPDPLTGLAYFEIKRNGATITISLGTNSDYVSNPSATDTISGTVDGLRYFQISNSNHGDAGNTYLMTGSLEELKLYNGVTSASKDKSSITDVPVGTRYEETDTRKIFRRAAGDENVGTSGTDSNWAEVVFDNSTIANNAVATGNAVTRSSGSDWDSFIRSSTNKLSPATGGRNILYTNWKW